MRTVCVTSVLKVMNVTRTNSHHRAHTNQEKTHHHTTHCCSRLASAPERATSLQEQLCSCAAVQLCRYSELLTKLHYIIVLICVLMRMFRRLMQVLLPAAQQLQLPARPSSRKRAFQTLRSMCLVRSARAFVGCPRRYFAIS